MKKIAIIPTLLTLGNAVCGFAAIACLSKIDARRPLPDDQFFTYAGWFILAAMLFDALDGYVARLSKAATNFGGQLDSLCDAISFGAAPALLLLRLGPGPGPLPTPEIPPDPLAQQLHQALSVVATLYMVCALLRLARFNVENAPDPESHKRFRGLPSPAAAGCIASLGILCGFPTDSDSVWFRSVFEKSPFVSLNDVRRFVEVFALPGGLCVGLLMVSRVSYPHVTNQFLRGRKRFRRLMHVILAVAVIYIIRELAIVLLFWGYTVFFVLRSFWLRVRRGPAPPPAAQPAPPESPEGPPRDSLKWPADVHRSN